MRRDHWQREIARLDPETEYTQIYRLMAAHEFPWDVTQALGLALYRTYAVPSIGELLARTGEFTERTHKRYADTGLILEAVISNGFGDATGRAALRRMNQMHGAYTISGADMRYVLSTFVVVPMRWLDAFGWRPMSEAEKVASANYYRELGRQMNIKDIPATYTEFATLLDDYERAHFAFSPGGRAVSDATLRLLVGFYPKPMRELLRRTTLTLLDDPLREAFRYPRPSRRTRALTHGALRARARLLAHFPARRDPLYVHERREFNIYPDGYRVEELGTFPSS